MPLAAGAAAFLCYVRTFGYGLVIWDDPSNLTENPYLHPVSLANLWRLWRAPYGDLYVPLVYTTYAAEIVLSGGKHWIFHVTNALLHAVSAVLVYAIARDFIRSRLAAAAGALVFALHPIQTEAVVWATGRKDVLSGAMAMLSIWLYLRAPDRGVSQPLEDAPPGQIPIERLWPAGGAPFRIAAFCAFVLSLLAKPAAAAVPLLLLAFGVFGLQRPWRRAVVALLPWFAVAAAWTLLTSQAQPNRTVVALWIRPFAAGDAVVFYLRKLLWPFGLAPVYGRRPWELTRYPEWWVGLPLAAAGLAFVVLRGTRFMKLVTALFVAGLLPTLGLKQFRYQNYSTVADRYLYLSMLGVALGAARGIELLLARRPRQRVLILAGLGAMLVFFAALSVRQQRFWSDSETLMNRCLEINPRNGAAHSLLALVRMGEGRVDDAIAENRAALRTLNYPDVHHNLGYALRKKRLYAEALQEYRIALQQDPKIASAHDGIGMIHMEMGNVAAAIPELREALRLDPSRRITRVNLGLALAQTKQYSEAVEQFEEALRAKPEAQVYAYIAEALAGAGEPAKAEAAVREAIRLDPQNAEIQEALRTIASKRGRQ